MDEAAAAFAVRWHRADGTRQDATEGPVAAFVVDWNHDAETRAFAAGRKEVLREHTERGETNLWEVSGHFHGPVVRYVASEGCDAIIVEDRHQACGSQLPRFFPLVAMVILDNEVPLTNAADGHYEDGDITAFVETYADETGASRQRIRVRMPWTPEMTERSKELLPARSDRKELYTWYDGLLEGNKADKLVSPSGQSTTTQQ